MAQYKPPMTGLCQNGHKSCWQLIRTQKTASTGMGGSLFAVELTLKVQPLFSQTRGRRNIEHL